MHVVIFTGGQAPEPEKCAHFFTHFSQVDYVITADSGLETFEKFKKFFGSSGFISPDLILGDMDSIQNKNLLEKYGTVRQEIYKYDKDFTDTEMALINAHEMITSYEQDIITLVGGCGGRVDHFISIFDSFSMSYHADVWLTSEQLVCYLKEGFTLEIGELRHEDAVSISRLTDHYDGGSLKSEGLAWEYPAFRKTGMPSVSNRISDDYLAKKKKVILTAEKGSFLVFLPYHANIGHPFIR